MEIKTYQYCTVRDRAGSPAWRDDQTGRWIKAATLVERTGLSLIHIKGFENGRDGYVYRMTYEERTAAEAAAGVRLY